MKRRILKVKVARLSIYGKSVMPTKNYAPKLITLLNLLVLSHTMHRTRDLVNTIVMFDKIK